MANKTENTKKRRGKGEGTIILRPDGSLMAQISIKDPKTGARSRPTVYGKTPKEIQMKLLKLRSDAANGINLSPEKVTLAGWIEQWIENYAKLNKKEVTWRAYEMNYKAHIKESHIGKKLLTKLTTQDLQRFYKEKLESGRKDGSGGLSVGTVIKLHNIIRASLTQAEEENLIRINVARAVKLPSERENRKEITPLNEEQITHFLNVIKGDKYFPAFLLELGTGMRKGELLGLKWEDINLETGELHIKRTLTRLVNGDLVFGPPKTKKSKRNIIIPPRALAALKEHHAKQNLWKMEHRDVYKDDDLVFAYALGEPVDPNAFYHNFIRKLGKAGLKHVSFHSLRHSVATILLNEGVNLKVVSDLLGHASVAVTGDIYSHVMKRAKQDTANTLDSILGSKLAVETKKQELQ